MYEIKYSPGLIFSNEVPGLDINFIKPMETKEYEKDVTLGESQMLSQDTTILKNLTKDDFTYIKTYKQFSALIPDDVKENYGFRSDNFHYFSNKDSTGMGYQQHSKYFPEVEHLLHVSKDEVSGEKYLYFWVDNNKLYKLEFVDITGMDNEYRLYVHNLEGSVKTEIIEQESIAAKLQSNIATWYIALRTIALVGLLSVLVYIGIRIILGSTSAEQKAKYKNMLKDWLVAICLLFVLHYIMAFMLEFTDKLNEIIKNGVVRTDSSGYIIDDIMSNLRGKIGNIGDDDTVIQGAAYTITYLVMVIFTITFTIQYLKRVVFMAFLTMVAPMIALTYPLDKIKDKKAQAFSYWLKEYIFNCLIQPVHLLLYTILVTSAIEFAKTNFLYTIACLAFLVPAEKFIKSMFGMKSESPVSTIGAAAGGALVMNAINKLKNVKGESGKNNSSSGSSSNVRTANNTGGGASSGGTGGSSRTSAGGGTGGSSGSGSTAGGSSSSRTWNSGITGSSLAGRKISGINRVGSATLKGLKGAGKYGSGALLGLGAGTLALAANIADGDLIENPTKAAGEIAGAGLVGYSAGKNLTGRGMNAIGRGREYLEKQALGVEEYNNRKFDKAFYKSDDYKMIVQDQTIQNICKRNNVSVQEATQTFLNEGITDGKIIKESLRNGISGEIYSTYAKEGISNPSEIAKAKSKHPRMSDEARINWMKLAKNAPNNLEDFKKIMVGREFNGVKLTESMATRVYGELINFM